MLYKFQCEDFDCGRWNRVIELPTTGGECKECQKPLTLQDDSNQLRASIARAEAMTQMAEALEKIALSAYDGYLLVKTYQE